MEIFDSSSVKRKRSNTSRRPRSENPNQSAVSHRKEISLNQFDGLNEPKLRKVKLKLGGVTRTLHPKSSRPRPKLILQDTSDDDDGHDFSDDPIRKGKRFPRSHVLDETQDQGREISSVSETRVVRGGYDHGVGYTSDYVGDEELASDPDFKRKKSVDTKEMLLTTRQRALQSGKDTSNGSAQSFIEFPNGLPPVLPRKKKEEVSEVEQQLRKAEAAQRRKMQVEKAARESEAEAIRKILGQDSSRKKREDRNKKRRDEIAQEKAANAMTLPPNTIRWNIRPTGTVVTFPEDMGLPSIFSSKPCSYPPPREKCAGPLCTNVYKYRDSKSNLPLCSLQCYKAVNGWVHPVSTF